MLSRTIWRKRWVLAALVALVPAPFAIIALAWSLPVTTRDFDQYRADLVGAFEETYGPSIADEYEAAMQMGSLVELRSTKQEDPFFKSMMAMNVPTVGMHGADAPSAATELERLESEWGEWFRNVDRVSTMGVSWRPPAADAKVPNFLKIQLASKARAARAVAAAHEGNWEAGLDEASAAARISDPARGSFIIGNLINIAARSICYGAFRRLLDEQPGPDESREAAKRLGELRATEADVEPVLWAADSAGVLNTFMEQRRAPASTAQFISAYIGGNVFMLGAADMAVSEAEHPEAGLTESWLLEGHRPHRYMLPWSAFPAARARIARAARKHPEMIGEAALANAIESNVPAGKRLYFGSSSIARPNLSEWLVRSRTSKTNGALMQAAYAARVYRAENDRWPESVEQLDSELFAPVPLESEAPVRANIRAADIAGPQPPFGPLRCGMVAMDEERLRELVATLARRAGFYSIDFKRIVDRAQGSGKKEVEFHPGGLSMEKDPAFLRVILRESLLGMRSGLVREVEMLDTDGRALSDDDLRRISEEASKSDEPFMQANPLLPPAALPGVEESLTTYAPRPPRIGMGSIRIVLAPPKEVFTIRSPGPDGEDDGGRIIYDPTNGTMSRGDLVVYPAGW